MLIMKSSFTIGVFGIIFDEQERVLLAHRRDMDLWNLPGGGLESGEAPLEGLKREVLEETGLHVEVMKLIGVYSKTDKDEIVFSFLCKKLDGELRLNEEADQLSYFAFDQMPTNISPKQRERITDALSHPQELIWKVQTGPSSVVPLFEE